MAPKKGIVLAEEQKKFIEKALAGKNIMLDGAEGSGKRTALRTFCLELDIKRKVLYFTNNRFAKNDVSTYLKKSNILVDYYNGFAFRELRKIGIYGEEDGLLEMFSKVKPSIKGYEYLVIAEFEDLTQEASKLLEVIKYRIPDIKIIAYGDVEHMISEPGAFNPRTFMEAFLGNYVKVDFKNNYVISSFDKMPCEEPEENSRDDLPDEESDKDTQAQEEAKGKRKRVPLGRNLKESAPVDNTPETKIAVIDTEINRKDEVMSVGLIIADALTFEPVLEQYYILEPEHTVGGDNQKHLRINEYVNAGSVSRKDALSKIRATLKENGIRSIFAYNAISDYERLVELATYNWYDIMQVAAYKLYNPAITDEDECHESGRLKKNFGVTDMLERLGGEGSGHENNAIYDARNELEILKLLKRPIGDYVFTRVSDDDSENDLDPESEDLGEDALTASEAEQILGVSRGTVYNLVKRGDIFGYKRGKRYIISEVSVREYLEKQEAAENFRYKSTVSGILLAILFALIYLWHLAAKML